MKKLIAFSLVAILTACGTTSQVSDIVSYTEQITPSEYFAGAPQIPGTTYRYTRITQILSETNGPTLRQAANYVDPANNNPQPDSALSTLEPISLDILNDYETAFVHRTRGYAYMAKKDYRKAANEFILMLNKRDYLSLAAEANTTKTLAILHYELQEYNLALQYMFKVAELSESISNDDYYQTSRIQERTGDYKNALKNINKSILILGDNSPEDTNLYYQHMAKIYEKMNSATKAD